MNGGVFIPLFTFTFDLHLILIHLQDCQRETNCHDMRTDLAVLLVGDARAFGMDASAGLELELDGHSPSARLLDLAGDFEGVVVVGDIGDVAGIADREGLVEDLLAAPLDQLLACDAALNHSSLGMIADVFLQSACV